MKINGSSKYIVQVYVNIPSFQKHYFNIFMASDEISQIKKKKSKRKVFLLSFLNEIFIIHYIYTCVYVYVCS